MCTFNHVYYNGHNTTILTPWCRVLLEKLTGLQLVNKFSAFHGTRRFITALTNVRHLSYRRDKLRPLVNTITNFITVQQDATYLVYYISVDSSTCFGC